MIPKRINGKSRNIGIFAGIGMLTLILVTIGILLYARSGSWGHAEIITNEAPAVAINAKDTDKATAENPFAGRYVTYEGITSIGTDGNALFANPADNDEDIFIEFVVSEDGEVLYSTELVPAGKGLDVDFSKFLMSGDHEVVVTMNPYLLCDGEYLRCPVNNAQSLKVTI